MAEPALNWHVRHWPVCASTEVELDRWLNRWLDRRPEAPSAHGQAPSAEAQTLQARLVVMARRQRYGHGQRGRLWHSPAGGLWISAAFPWPAAQPEASPLGMAVAVGMAQQLQSLGVPVSLKWPNDLLVEGRKLAGLLPRLRWRGGTVRWAQVGLGINGTNRPPVGAISVAQALAGDPFHPLAKPQRLLPLALAAFDWAQQVASDPAAVHQAAEALLLRPPEGLLHGGERWQVAGLERDGGLRLERPGAAITLQRSF